MDLRIQFRNMIIARWLIFLGCCAGFRADAQRVSSFSRIVTGKVVSTEGKRPLSGATLILRESNTSAITDDNGSFKVRLTAFPDTLSVHAVGYQNRKIIVNKRTDWPLIISLESNVTKLQQVTVSTGYQDIPKARATGSFEKIDNSLLNRQVSTDIISRLEGVSSIRFDKNINRPPITIRGFSSINGPKDPLIILDNFPYEGDINNINPNDVESVTILKDAAAASIWGTRAGNGVIVITTKKGSYNRPFSMELNTNVTLTSKPDVYYLKQMKSGDFIDVEKFLFSKGYYNGKESNTYSRPPLTPVVELLIAERDGKITADEAESKINALRNLDVRDDFNNYIYQPAVKQQYALNINGGSETLKYFLSGGYDRNLSELAAGYERLSFRSENAFRPFKNLEISAGITYTQSKNHSGRPDYQILAPLYPYARFADDEGSPLPLSRYRQPYIDTAGGGLLLDWNYYPLEDYKHNTTNVRQHDMLLNLGIDYQLVKGLHLNVKYQLEKQRTEKLDLQDLESYYTRDLINKFSQINVATGEVAYIVPKGAILDRVNTSFGSYNLRFQLDYNKTWGKHNITAIAGNEIRQSHIADNSSRIYGYDDDILTVSNVDYVNRYPYYISGSKRVIPNNLYLSDLTNRFVSFYANGAYTYNRRYTISASARRDTSNLFGVKTNDQWQPLWSAGIGWNISNEDFYRSSFLNYLKFRATYGYSGNVGVHKSALTTLIYSSFPASYSNFTYASINHFSNPALRWEKVNMLNVGIDFEIENNVLSGSIEYYAKKGADLFGPSPIDYTSGIGQRSMIINVANMKGSGVDITLNSRNIDKAFKWQTALLFEYNTSKITKYNQTSPNGSNYINDGGSISALEGKPVYSVLSYKWAGLDANGNPQGIIDGKPSTEYSAIMADKTQISDLVYGGPAVPPVYGSLNNMFSWKGLALTAGITFKFGYYFRKRSINYGQLFSRGVGNADFSRRWKEPGDESFTSVPSLVYPNNSNRDGFYSGSEVLVRKADNIRLNYIDLSYSLPEAALERLSLKGLQFYMNIMDLGLIWKANKEGIDPDYGITIPPSKKIALGLKVKL